jgi:hypothetical protein
MRFFGQSRKVEPALDRVVIIEPHEHAYPPAITAEILRDMLLCVSDLRAKIPTMGCVAASAAICDVLLSCGVDAECVSVEVVAANARIQDLINFGKIADADSAIGSSVVGVFDRPELDTDLLWYGHLIVVVNGRWLVDATLDQFEKDAAEKDIELRPVVAGRGADLLANGHCSFRIGKSFVLYRRAEGNQRYRDAPSWQERASRIHGFTELMRALKGMTEGSDGRKFIERHLERRRRLDEVYRTTTSG